MKRLALVLIFLIGMIGSTGFGSTTADLTKDSTTEVVQMDALANVATVAVQADLNQVFEETPMIRFLYDPGIELTSVIEDIDRKPFKNNKLPLLTDFKNFEADYNITVPPLIRTNPHFFS